MLRAATVEPIHALSRMRGRAMRCGPWLVRGLLACACAVSVAARAERVMAPASVDAPAAPVVAIVLDASPTESFDTDRRDALPPQPVSSDEAGTGASPADAAVEFLETGWRQQGVASWYGGQRWHGRRTASGESFDRHALTAAHRSLPLGSWVRVLNPANGLAVVVRINDRGPFARNHIIDLSEAAAELLDLRHAGRGRVHLALLSPP